MLVRNPHQYPSQIEHTCPQFNDRRENVGQGCDALGMNRTRTAQVNCEPNCEAQPRASRNQLRIVSQQAFQG